MPSTASQSRVSEMEWRMFSHVSRNFPPEKESPRTSFTWDVAMIMAAAEVNPADTGPEMKSIKKPKKKNKAQVRNSPA